MNELNELLQKRARLIAQGRELTDKALKEKRSMTGEETQAYDKIFKEVGEIDETRQRVEQQIAAERATAAVIETADRNDNADPRMKAFRHWVLTGERRALQADADAGGGFLKAPPTFVKELIKAVDDLLFVRQLATVMTIQTSEAIQPSLETNPDDSSWTNEVTAAPEDSSMAFGRRELKPHKLAKLIKVSRPLLRLSALPAESIVRDRLAYKNALSQEKAFMTGTGANQPLGLFTASAQGIPTTRDYSTGNTSTAIQFNGLIGAKYNTKGQYHKTGVWIFHRDAVAQIAKLVDGNGQYIWQPSKQVSDPDMLLGNPIYMSENAPNTFTSGLYVGLFGDLKHYHIADSLDAEIQRLDELYAATNQVGFISRSETDGMPVLAEAFTRVKLG